MRIRRDRPDAASRYRATEPWSSRRDAFGSVAYATSRINTCLNANSTSPSTLLSRRREIRPRTSSASRPSSTPSSSPAPSRTSRQNVCPITDACRSAARAPAGRVSILAAIAARTVEGSSAPETSPATDAVSSSRNSGLPSATETTRSIASGCTPGSSAAATAADASVPSGSSGSVVCPTIPPPHVRRVSRNSGRASAITTTRASLTWVTR